MRNNFTKSYNTQIQVMQSPTTMSSKHPAFYTSSNPISKMLSPHMNLSPNHRYRNEKISTSPFYNIDKTVADRIDFQKELNSTSRTWNQIENLLSKPVYSPEGLLYPQHQHHYNKNHKQIEFDMYQSTNRHTRHQTFSLSPSKFRQIQQSHNKSHIKLKQHSRINSVMPQNCNNNRIQYFPYIRKYYEYEPRQISSFVYLPVEKQITQYYTVEHITDYQLQEFEQTVVQYIPNEKINHRIQYLPVQHQIVHYPQRQLMKKQNKQQQIHRVSSPSSINNQQLHDDSNQVKQLTMYAIPKNKIALPHQKQQPNKSLKNISQQKQHIINKSNNSRQQQQYSNKNVKNQNKSQQYLLEHNKYVTEISQLSKIGSSSNKKSILRINRKN